MTRRSNEELGTCFEEYHINVPYMEQNYLSISDQLEGIYKSYGDTNAKFATEAQIRAHKNSTRVGQAKGGFIKYANKRKGLLNV